MVAVPEAIPETTPVPEPIDAIVASLLLHVPPPASVRVVFVAIHTEDAPLIDEGNAFTVITVVAWQPVLSV
jgi:hypothetical protein